MYALGHDRISNGKILEVVQDEVTDVGAIQVVQDLQELLHGRRQDPLSQEGHGRDLAGQNRFVGRDLRHALSGSL